ncbi:hypothetical protein [Alcaligenes faecalis]|uniref:hypothetical protein n=1 Tax=Alcaligenes faecalis TaxID=511 RepID=UPI003204B5B1
MAKLNNTAPEDVELFVKLASFNPGGSVKDRLALSVILDAQSKGSKQCIKRACCPYCRSLFFRTSGSMPCTG